MKTLLSYMRQLRRDAILAPLFKMLEAIFELIVPLIVASMIDRGVNGHQRGALLSGFVLLVVMAVTGFVSTAFAQYFSARCASQVSRKMRSDLFSHILRLPFSTQDQIGSASLITRMSIDINQVETAVNMFLRLFLRSPFIVIGAVVMALFAGGHAAIPFLVVVPILALVVSLVMFGTIPLFHDVQARLDAILARLRENLRGVRVIRAFARERDEIRRFGRENRTLYTKKTRSAGVTALLSPVTYVFVNLGIIMILYLGGRHVDAGQLSQGRVVALVNYMSQILIELIKLANLIILLSRGAASMRRVDAVFAVPEEARSANAAFPRMDAPRSLRILDLSFAYAGSKKNALEQIDLTLRKGESLGIIGGTAAGKSTLLKLIAGFYEPCEGEIRIAERQLSTIKTEALRRHIGFVPQDSVLFSGTLRDNLLYGGVHKDDQELSSILCTAQADGIRSAHPAGLDQRIEQGGKNLSGGQRQRVAIARALAIDPDILILDDATSALDAATEAALRTGLDEYMQGRTVVIASQRVSAIRHADSILVLDNGMQAGFGTHTELLRDCSVYRELCHAQMDEDAFRKEVADAKQSE